MLDNLKLRRSTYIIFILWGMAAFFVASSIFKSQAIRISFSINDGRLLAGLLRGGLLLLVYVVFTVFSSRLAIAIPGFLYFGILGSYLWQLTLVAFSRNWRGIAIDLLFIMSYIILIYCATMMAFQIIQVTRKKKSHYYFSKWGTAVKRVIRAHWLSLIVVTGAYVVLWSVFSLV